MGKSKVMKAKLSGKKMTKKTKGRGGITKADRQKKLTADQVRKMANTAPSITDAAKFKAWSPPMAVKQMAFMAQYQAVHGPLTASTAGSMDPARYFTPKEVSHLWMDMKRKKVKKASADVQAKWADLSEKKGRTGALKEKKRCSLFRW